MIKSKFNLIKFSAGIFCALQLAGFMLILACPLPVSAQISPQVTQALKFKPQITIPNSEFNKQVEIDIGKYNSASGTMVSSLLPRYIKTFYDYGLAIAGILATIVLMGGGVIWLTSGGDSGKITQAKELIIGSITGVLILVVSWIILNTINPNLINLAPITTKVINKIDYCCDPIKGNVPMELEKDGKCPSGTTFCNDEKTCMNTGNDKFACAKNAGSTCCEYLFSSIDGPDKIYCKTITSGICQKDYNYYSLAKSYPNTFCGNRAATGANCLQGLVCPGQYDGTLCSDKASYCYNETCYANKGKKNEPCGDRAGAICLAGTALDPCPDYYGHNFVQLNLMGIFSLNGPLSDRGRNCESGLYCCAPTPGSK